MAPLELTEVPTGPERENWVSLLELADEPRPLRRYLHEGVLLGIRGPGGRPRSARRW